MRRAVQFGLLAYSCLSIPILLLTPQILFLWLGQVPQYSDKFLQLIILANLLNTIVTINSTANHATGCIKFISFINGSLYILCPIISYILYKFGAGINATYVVDIAITALIVLIGILINKYQIPQYNIKSYLIPVLKSLIAFLMTFLCIWFLKNSFSILNPNYLCEDWWHVATSVLLMSIFSIVLSLTITYIIALNKNERLFLLDTIKNTILRKFGF